MRELQPDDVMPYGHHAGQFVAALTPFEREQVAEWPAGMKPSLHNLPFAPGSRQRAGPIRTGQPEPS